MSKKTIEFLAKAINNPGIIDRFSTSLRLPWKAKRPLRFRLPDDFFNELISTLEEINNEYAKNNRCIHVAVERDRSGHLVEQYPSVLHFLRKHCYKVKPRDLSIFVLSASKRFLEKYSGSLWHELMMILMLRDTLNFKGSFDYDALISKRENEALHQFLNPGQWVLDGPAFYACAFNRIDSLSMLHGQFDVVSHKKRNFNLLLQNAKMLPDESVRSLDGYEDVQSRYLIEHRCTLQQPKALPVYVNRFIHEAFKQSLVQQPLVQLMSKSFIDCFLDMAKEERDDIFIWFDFLKDFCQKKEKQDCIDAAVSYAMLYAFLEKQGILPKDAMPPRQDSSFSNAEKELVEPVTSLMKENHQIDEKEEFDDKPHVRVSGVVAPSLIQTPAKPKKEDYKPHILSPIGSDQSKYGGDKENSPLPDSALEGQELFKSSEFEDDKKVDDIIVEELVDYLDTEEDPAEQEDISYRVNQLGPFLKDFTSATNYEPKSLQAMLTELLCWYKKAQAVCSITAGQFAFNRLNQIKNNSTLQLSQVYGDICKLLYAVIFSRAKNDYISHGKLYQQQACAIFLRLRYTLTSGASSPSQRQLVAAHQEFLDNRSNGVSVIDRLLYRDDSTIKSNQSIEDLPHYWYSCCQKNDEMSLYQRSFFAMRWSDMLFSIVNKAAKDLTIEERCFVIFSLYMYKDRSSSNFPPYNGVLFFAVTYPMTDYELIENLEVYTVDSPGVEGPITELFDKLYKKIDLGTFPDEDDVKLTPQQRCLVRRANNYLLSLNDDDVECVSKYSTQIDFGLEVGSDVGSQKTARSLQSVAFSTSSRLSTDSSLSNTSRSSDRGRGAHSVSIQHLWGSLPDCENSLSVKNLQIIARYAQSQFDLKDEEKSQKYDSHIKHALSELWGMKASEDIISKQGFFGSKKTSFIKQHLVPLNWAKVMDLIQNECKRGNLIFFAFYCLDYAERKTHKSYETDYVLKHMKYLYDQKEYLRKEITDKSVGKATATELTESALVSEGVINDMKNVLDFYDNAFYAVIHTVVEAWTHTLACLSEGKYGNRKDEYVVKYASWLKYDEYVKYQHHIAGNYTVELFPENLGIIHSMASLEKASQVASLKK